MARAWLLLACAVRAAVADTGQAAASTYPVAATYCEAGGASATSQYQYFSTGDIGQTSYTPQGWADSRQPAAPAVYEYDATELAAEALQSAGTGCVVCRYHWDAHWAQVGLDPDLPPIGGGLRSGNYRPMFGPCFSGAPSQLMPCAQNVALFPPTYVGQYYYPLQRPSDAFEGGGFPLHFYFTSDYASSDIATVQAGQATPDAYGLGKTAVVGDLDSFELYNATTGQAATALIAAFRLPYVAQGGVDQWPKWAQHWCEPGCHRDSQYLLVAVQAADLADPRNSYLGRFRQNGTTNQLLKCSACPAGYSAYQWYDGGGVDTPLAIGANYAAATCFPMFGYLPLVHTGASGNGLGGDFTTVTVTHGAAVDGVLVPSLELKVLGAPCPPNTYNRVCAHAIRYYYLVATQNRQWWPPSLYNATMANATCKPCPAGYTTGGKNGSWFCLPPPGNVFGEPGYVTTRLASVPNPWASRDVYQAEFECGYLPSHCQQCNTTRYASLQGFLPADFNEAVFFASMLATRPCAANSYCPDAFTELPCPPATPYAPPGASSPAQCGCNAGAYLAVGANGTRACTRCTPASTCGAGTYMPLDCLAANGATADEGCRPCTNIPAGAVAVPGSTELVVVQAGANNNATRLGLCSFQCPRATTLVSTSPDSTPACVSAYQCAPVGIVRYEGVAVFAVGGDAMRDAFDATACPSSPLSAEPVGNALLQLANAGVGGLWQKVSASCACQGLLCYNPRASAADPAAWYDFGADVACLACPNHSTLPLYGIPGPSANSVVAPQAQACASVACSPATCGNCYFNATAWACQDCGARARQVCTAANRTTLCAGGCLGCAKPFNLTDPQADCVNCNLDPALAGPGRYLNLNQVGAGGCAYADCVAYPAGAEPNLYYQSENCSGVDGGAWALCDTAACQPGTFQFTACATYSDKVCHNCTDYNPGSYVVAKCWPGGDAAWAPCPPGFYCNGTGGKTPCPAGKTSLYQTVAPGNCFCAVGTVSSADGCAPFHCPNTTQAPAVPGLYGVAADYMYLAYSQAAGYHTACAPCGNGSHTRGDGIGPDACVCPPGEYYASRVGAQAQETGHASATCTACPATRAALGACAPPSTFGPSCWAGDARAAPACACAAPPFGALGGGGACGYVCDAGFAAASAVAVLRSGPGATGSALYAPAGAAWDPFVVANLSDTDDTITAGFTVAALAVTHDDLETAYQPGEPQFVLWALAGCLNVYYTQVPFAGSVQRAAVTGFANLDYYLTEAWRVVDNLPSGPTGLTDNNGFTYSIVGLAVSPWARGAGGTREPNTTYVGAVVLVDQGPCYAPAGHAPSCGPTTGRSLWLYPKTLRFDLPATWQGAQDARLSLTAGTGLHVVGVASSSIIPGSPGAVAGGVFFVAYNTADPTTGALQCGQGPHVQAGAQGVAIVAPWTNGDYAIQAVPLDVCSGAPGPMGGFAVGTPNDGLNTVTLYISFADGVYAVPLGPERTVSLAGLNLSPVFAGLVVGLHLLFPSQPALLALAANTTGCASAPGQACLVAADGVQRTFVQVEGMPWGTAPSLAPAGAPTGLATAVVVVAYASTLYALDVATCLPNSAGLPQYWDGSDFGQLCLQQQCIRTPQCTGAHQVLVDNFRCECSPGAYLVGSQCVVCGQNFYCAGGTAPPVGCPGQTTSPAGAASLFACTCLGQGTATFVGTPALGDCQACLPGHWCPNGWLAFACPGAVDSVRTPELNAVEPYPTACVCAAGATGAACGACPDGYYCPASATATAVNMGVLAAVVARPGAAAATPAQVAAAVANYLLTQVFQTYGGAPAYLQAAATLAPRLYVALVPATNYTAAGLAVVVQVDTAADAAAVADWGGTLSQMSAAELLPAGLASVGATTPALQPFTQAVPANVAVRCPAGTQPVATADACACAPGYTGAKCAACAANNYKPLAGAGVCTPCPVGQTAPAGAANCTVAGASPPSAPSASAGGLSTVMIAAIAGGGGGVLLLTGLAFYCAQPPPHAGG